MLSLFYKGNLILMSLLVVLLCYPLLGLADVSSKIEQGARHWTMTADNLELKIVQMMPEQAHAFYLARGFKTEVARDIGASCMMQTVVTNKAAKTSGKAFSISLKKWQLKVQGNAKLQGIKLKETWDRHWKTDDISAAARIAFRWATFPSEQTFEPHGDYNWGMISFGLTSGSRFDLNVVWHQEGHQKSIWIRNMQCQTDNMDTKQ